MLVVAVGLSSLSSSLGAAPNWDDYSGVLTRHTRTCVKGGVRLVCVNYAALKADPAWARVVRGLAAANLSAIGGPTDRMAFYINAYNILAIDTIVRRGGASSINSNPNVWKASAGVVGGRTYSLDGLEKGVIKSFGNPLYHFALVCAAVSCPDLRRTPYTGPALGRELHQQTVVFLSNPSKGVRLLDGRRALVSKLFEWYKDEFDRVGGTDAFIGRYLRAYPGHTASGFLNYDWQLNGN